MELGVCWLVKVVDELAPLVNGQCVRSRRELIAYYKSGPNNAPIG